MEIGRFEWQISVSELFFRIIEALDWKQDEPYDIKVISNERHGIGFNPIARKIYRIKQGWISELTPDILNTIFSRFM